MDDQIEEDTAFIESRRCPIARRTERLVELQYQLALALGGEAGKRLADRLAMSSSTDTLLRLIVRAGCAAEPPPVPRVLAVDGWA